MNVNDSAVKAALATLPWKSNDMCCGDIEKLISAEEMKKALEAAFPHLRAPEIGYEKISIDKNGLQAVLEEGQEIVKVIAQNFFELLKAHEAPNFVEMSFEDGEGQGIVVTIINRDGETPANQIKRLKARIKELEEEKEDARYEAMEREERRNV